jgi:hypothetical protein
VRIVSLGVLSYVKCCFLLAAAAGDDGRVRLLNYPCVVDEAPARCAADNCNKLYKL